VIRELGKHAASGNEIQILQGRYGPYVSDGRINATLPKTMDPDEVDMEAAVELLAKKAARGGGRGGARKRAPTKKGGGSSGRKAAPRKKKKS
jgi:DNA topoisomerase-1